MTNSWSLWNVMLTNKLSVSMCDLTTCTWQDLPSIFPSYMGTGSDLKTNEIIMAGLAGCTFEIKFEQSRKHV
jgi:hypothetical protein